MKFDIFLKVSIVLSIYISKTLRLNNLKTRTAMNEKVSVFINCVEAILHLLFYNMHDCTFHYLNKICL